MSKRKAKWFIIGAIHDPKNSMATAIAIQNVTPEEAIKEFEDKFKMRGYVVGVFKGAKARIFRRVITTS